MTDSLYIRPSDARSWLHCKRRAWYDNFPPENMLETDPFEELIRQMAIRHQQSVKQYYEQKLRVIEATSVEHTDQLMADGVDAIYHPQIVDHQNKILGQPNFLIRNADGQYQTIDAKLSRKEDKKAIKIQLGIYHQLMGSGLPALAILGDNSTAEFGDETYKEVAKFLSDMRSILSINTPPEVRYSKSKCDACPYVEICKPAFEAVEDLTLLYGITSPGAPHLEAQGIDTITTLADLNPEDISSAPYFKDIDKKQRAVWQAQSYKTGAIFEVQTPILPNGTWVHFDIETNPLTDNGEEHVYLWGFLKPPYDNSAFEYIWTDSQNDDEQGWHGFLELMAQYRQQYPDLILCHFSNYEKATIKHYVERYDMAEHPIVIWLLGDEKPLFDIHRVVKDSFVLPLDRLGLKDICKHEDLVNFQWSNEESGAQWSVVQFHNYLAEQNETQREQMKQDIIAYNIDDVMATRKLEEWLRSFC